MGILGFLGIGSTAETEKITNMVSEKINRNTQELVQSYVQNASAIGNVRQRINIADISCTGNVNITDVSQRAGVLLDLKSVSNNTSEAKFNADIRNVVDQAVSTTQEAESAISIAASASNSTRSNVKNRIVNETASSYTYNNFKNDTAQLSTAQGINIANIRAGQDCNIANITQDAQLKSLVRSISKNLTRSFSDAINRNASTQSDDSQQTSVDTGIGGVLPNISNWILYGGIFLLLIVVAIVLGVVYSGSEPEAVSVRGGNEKKINMSGSPKF